MAVLTPPPRYNVLEWADERRFLSPESSARPGKYRSSYAPFQRAPMEDATDQTVESVTLMWCSQIGKSEILTNVIGYFIDIDPAPILMVQPTVEMAESFSKERITPMVRDTPALKGKVKEARSRDSGNTISLKSFPGGSLAFVGANAPGGLAGRPRRVVLMDEVDRFPASAGTEGDPCSLAERRTETFWNAVIYRTSTPTVKGFSRIESAFEQTDKRRWFCPCPKCGHHQHLKWSHVLWGKSRVEAAKRWGYVVEPATSEAGADAVYECEGCHAHLSDSERLKMVLAGEWRATAPFNGKRGYHLNGIASPFKAKKGFKSRLHQMVAGFLESKHGGRETFKTWVNTFLAETFEEESEKIEHGPLLLRGETYSPTTLPDQIVLATAQVDVQRDRLELETVGVGLNDESWGIERLAFFGDTEQDDVWADLADALSKKYQRSDGVEIGISATAIDMRHKPQKVRKFVGSCGLPRVYPVYGIAGTQPILVTTRFNKHYHLRTYAVQTKLGKDTIFSRLRVDVMGPRYMHFPKGFGYDEEFFLQLTAEVKKTKYAHGFPTEFYEKTRDRNEALDLRVYWLACLDILKPNLSALLRKLKSSCISDESVAKSDESEKQNAEAKTDMTPPQPSAPKKSFRPQRPGGFINRWKR